MNDRLEFTRLIPWLWAVGALIAASLICVLSGNRKRRCSVRVMRPRVDPKGGVGCGGGDDVSPAGLHKHMEKEEEEEEALRCLTEHSTGEDVHHAPESGGEGAKCVIATINC